MKTSIIKIFYEGAPVILDIALEHDEMDMTMYFKLYYNFFRETPILEFERCLDSLIAINKNSVSFRTTQRTELVITKKEANDQDIVILNLFEISSYTGCVLYNLNFRISRGYGLHNFISNLKEALKGTDFIDENKEV
jgi:hypothetical protein